MDEATSALDSETEERIVKELESVFSERTRIIIAHRLSTVAKSDLIIVVNIIILIY